MKTALASALPTVDPTGYSSTQFATDIAANIGIVLAYVGVAVAAGFVVFFGLVGLRVGIRWIKKLVNG